MKTTYQNSQAAAGLTRLCTGVLPVMATVAVILLATVAPTWAQDTAPAAPEQPAALAAPSPLENEFEAFRAAQATSAPAAAAPADELSIPDPLSALTSPTPEGDAVLITNQDVPSPAPADLTPVDGADATPPDMPQAAAPAQAEVQAPVQAPASPAVAAPGNDPLAPFRAQQAIREAEQRSAAQQQSSGNPLGPAAQLPLGAGGLTQSPEELQAQLDAEAELQQERLKQQVFDGAVESLLPLTPDQTRSMLDSFRQSREAAETPIAVPKARTTVENVSLDPSVAPPGIQTAPGYVTTLTILDMTGAPWAIQDVSWAGKFEVTTPEEGGHVIRITPMSAHGVGNISIRLVDLITPITFSINTGLDVVDFRYDARIPKAGPLAKTPLIANGGLTTVAGTDENLMRVLDGTAVGTAARLTLDGVDGATTAYSINDTMYLRTPLTLLSPAWQSSATSADGMNVYTLKTTPVILLSDKGRMVKARLKAPE